MNCPICNSDQTNTFEVRSGYYFVECVSCDSETYHDGTEQTYADFVEATQAYYESMARETGRRHARRRGR